MGLLLGLAGRIRLGSLEVVTPEGESYRFEGQEAGPSALLHIRHERVVRRLLTGGTLGFCEAYLDGEWTSPDLTALFKLALLNEQHFDAVLNGKPWLRRLSNLLHVLRPNSKSGSKRNIVAHYDLGNDFYARWLDASMTYSSAIYADLAKAEALTQAQDRKYDALCQRLALKPGMHVLEIGCGWGGFAEYAARRYGVRITAVTISPSQHAYATARIINAGLAGQVEIKLCDYRDITGQYDAIASIEMFEAVGEKYWPVYAQTLNRLLGPGARAALQVITIDEAWFPSYRLGGDYIQRYVFPGGMLPSKTALKHSIEATGLQQIEQGCYGLHYARTLREWNDEFQSQWNSISLDAKFDTRFKRLWEQYLCYCEAGFEVGTIDVVQTTFVKPA
jgi:cyclopropane-fatty-acyl-phospholipid synthase